MVKARIHAHRLNGGGRFFDYGIIVRNSNFSKTVYVNSIQNRQIVKERIEDGANEKAALRFPITALSFASISIFPG